jgi:hypothetical protein
MADALLYYFRSKDPQKSLFLFKLKLNGRQRLAKRSSALE